FHKRISYTKKVNAILETTPLEDIMKLFVTTKYRRLPVVDTQGVLVGIVTRRDLMRVIYYRSKLA
ncbi:MAG: CBS domain-containing protein, partial [Proteobacteria bacterium]